MIERKGDNIMINFYLPLSYNYFIEKNKIRND